MRRWLLLMILSGLFFYKVSACVAIEPEKVESVVYRLQSFNGVKHQLVYSPPQIKEIYLLAGTNNTFDPRQTLIYYWPLTREYIESWEKLDVSVQGTLEIIRDGKVIQTLQREKVVFFYPEGADRGASILLQGEDAVIKRMQYDKLAKDFQKELSAYADQMFQYRKNLREFLRSGTRNNSAARPPAPPPAPVPPRLYMSDMIDVFVVNMPVGRYTIRIKEDDGAYVQGSERVVILFQAQKTEGVGYEIMPEDRWTAREQADDPEAGIYCTAGKDLFFIPYRTEAYDENAYVRLTNPQGKGRQGYCKWIHTEPIQGAKLYLFNQKQPIRTVDYKPYYVQHVPGAELGYKIIEYDQKKFPDESPTFSAFRTHFEEKDRGKRYQIAIRIPTTDNQTTGSEREIRIVGGAGIYKLWFVSFFPSVAGIWIYIWRKKKTQFPQKNAKGQDVKGQGF